MNPAEVVVKEHERRQRIWSALKSTSDDLVVRPGVLHDLAVMRGQRGVYRDLPVTKAVMSDGVAVSLHHTGKHYDDELDDDSVIYHFPSTANETTDRGEIASLFNAKATGLPLFVVIDRGDMREVRLGQVLDVNAELGSCHVKFEARPTLTPAGDTTNLEEWRATEERTKSETRSNLSKRRAAFRYDVLSRYGGKCAVTGIGVPSMLDAAHVIEVRDRGSDHPENGILLTKGLHGAFDAYLWAIDPTSMKIVARERGPYLLDMGISGDQLQSDAPLPNMEALERRWSKFRERNR